MPEQARRTGLQNVFYLFARLFHVFFILFLVVTYLLAMPLGIYFFYFTEEGAIFSRQLLIKGIPIVVAPFGGDPWWEPLYVMAGWWLATGWLFAGLWLVLCACLFFAWTGPGEGLRGGLSKLKNFSLPWGNYLLMFPLLASLAYSSAFFLENILFPSMGVPVGPVLPGIPPHVKFLLITNSAVTEEIGFRLVPLGLPFLFLLLAYKRNRDFLRSVSWRQRAWTLMLSLLEPTMAKNKVDQGVSIEGKNVLEVNQGFRRGLTKIEYFFVLISSVIFGLGHLGWSPGNAISVCVSSVVFGYAYYIYGIAGSILLHWFWNYYFSVYSYTSSYFPILDYVHGMSFFLHIFAGFVLWAILLVMILRAIVPRIRLRVGKIRETAGLTIKTPPVKRVEKAEVKPEITKIEEAELRICPRCGAKLPAEAEFCGKCGERL